MEEMMQTGASTKSNVSSAFDPMYADFIREIFGVDSLIRQRVYAAFYKQYRALVIHECGKRNKYTKNFEDLEAKLWLDFMGTAETTGLIDKFFAQAADVAPETMTATEAAAFLGIKLQAFTLPVWGYHVGFQGNIQGLPVATSNRYRKAAPWMPTPISGGYLSATAVYKFEDILRLSVEHVFVSSVGIQVIRPKATKKHFVNYLKRCIANRFANFCRYEDRRHKERIWDTFADQRSQLEEAPAWEERQETNSTQEEEAELSLLVRQLQSTAAASFLKPILLAVVDDGLTVHDAIHKCDGLTDAEKRIAIRATLGYKSETPAPIPRRKTRSVEMAPPESGVVLKVERESVAAVA